MTGVATVHPALPSVNPSGKVPYRVELYEGGAMLTGSIFPPNPTGKGGGKRGAVGEWSLASRRRMREFLLTRRPPEGWLLYAVTFTLPGPPGEPQAAKALFADWSQRANLAGWCAVWRLEVQERGALHWHLLVALPGEPVPGVSWCEVVRAEWWALQVQRSWHEAIDRAEPSDGSGEYEDRKGRVWSSRMAMPGAVEHSADVQHDHGNGGGAWLRYMRDHATKRKQAQCPVGLGRHWGVIGRARWVQAYPAAVCDLSLVEYARMLRWLQRLVRPRVPAPGAPFGSKLGWRGCRGRRGASVWFTRPDTVRRAALWAMKG